MDAQPSPPDHPTGDASPGLLDGIVAAMPVYPAVALVGLAFGASARGAGVPMEIVAASSLFVFSGAAQLTGLALSLQGGRRDERRAPRAITRSRSQCS